MKIFVTGVAGFLGSHLAERLIDRGNTVVGIDNLSGGYLDNVPKGVSFYKEDCFNRERMVEFMDGCELVYHLACAGHEGLSNFSPHYITSNTFGTSISVISAAIQTNVRRFVLCSSAARYGNLNPPFTEDMLPNPVDPYGIAKYASDLTLIELATLHKMEYCIAVPHNIIGTRQKYDDPYRNVASIFINLMLQNRSPIIYGDGLQERTFSFVSDVVDPLVKMGILPKANGEVINIGPDKNPTTVLELATIIKTLTGFSGKFLFVPSRPKEVRRVDLCADKARKLLEYEAKKELEIGLAEMIVWIRRRGTKFFEYKLPVEFSKSPILPVTWKERMM